MTKQSIAVIYYFINNQRTNKDLLKLSVVISLSLSDTPDEQFPATFNPDKCMCMQANASASGC